MVRDGSDKAFTLTPAAGYEVGDVVVNHKSLGAVTSFTVKDIDTDTSMEVTFVKTGNTVVGTKSTSNPSTGAGICAKEKQIITNALWGISLGEHFCLYRKQFFAILINKEEVV